MFLNKRSWWRLHSREPAWGAQPLTAPFACSTISDALDSRRLRESLVGGGKSVLAADPVPEATASTTALIIKAYITSLVGSLGEDFLV